MTELKKLRFSAFILMITFTSNLLFKLKNVSYLRDEQTYYMHSSHVDFLSVRISVRIPEENQHKRRKICLSWSFRRFSPWPVGSIVSWLVGRHRASAWWEGREGTDRKLLTSWQPGTSPSQTLLSLVMNLEKSYPH